MLHNLSFSVSCYVYHCLSISPSSFALSVSSIYVFWLPLWYLQTLFSYSLIWKPLQLMAWRSLFNSRHIFSRFIRGRCGRDRMVVGFPTAVQSMHITTKVVSLNPIHGEGYSILHYVIKYVSDLWQIVGFLWVLRFPPPIKLTATI
jgi:hypothetical protein